MIVFDTDAWNPADRVERWREEFGRKAMGSEVLATGEHPEDSAVRMAMLGGPSPASPSVRLRAVRKVHDRSRFKDGAASLTFMLCREGSVRYDANGHRRGGRGCRALARRRSSRTRCRSSSSRPTTSSSGQRSEG